MSVTLDLEWGSFDDEELEDITNQYTSYEGTEWLAASSGASSAGELNCELEWALSGKPVSTISGDGESCEFLFNVTYTLDKSSSYDNGTCKDFLSDSYGYSSGFGGRGTS